MKKKITKGKKSKQRKISKTKTQKSLSTEKEKTVSEGKEEKFILATGRRKSAVAKVKFFPQGKGKILVNGKDYKVYFPFVVEEKKIESPIKLVNLKNFDFIIKVHGGGKTSQAEAIRLAISKTLEKFNPNWRKILKTAGFLTRDARVKERKKYGLKRARRAPQWQKR